MLFRDPDQNAHLVGALIKKTLSLFSILKVLNLLAIPVLLCCYADLKIQMGDPKESFYDHIYLHIF